MTRVARSEVDYHDSPDCRCGEAMEGFLQEALDGKGQVVEDGGRYLV
jgi:hypothetical protein